MIEFKYFMNIFTFLQKKYNVVLDDSIIKFYYNRLKGLSINDFEQSVRNIIDTFKPTNACKFPEINSFIPSFDDMVINAIIIIKKAISIFGRYETVSLKDARIHAAIEQIGGWIEICNWNKEDWQFNETKFKEVLYHCFKFNVKGEDKLIGLQELENSAKNYIDYIPKEIKTIGIKEGKTIVSKEKNNLFLEDKSINKTENSIL